MHEFEEERLEKILERIKYHILREGISQLKLAKANSCSLNVIRRYVTGKCFLIWYKIDAAEDKKG